MSMLVTPAALRFLETPLRMQVNVPLARETEMLSTPVVPVTVSLPLAMAANEVAPGTKSRFTFSVPMTTLL